MAIIYYDCRFQNPPEDMEIVIKTERALTDLDALHILHKHYAVCADIYSANHIELPPLGTFNGILETQRHNFRDTVVITDGDEIPIERNVLACPPTNKYPLGLKLDLPAYMPAGYAESLLTEIAEAWAYENKMVRCTWANFLDSITDEFLARYHITRTNSTPANSHLFTPTPKDHVKTQKILVILRDNKQTVTAIYKCTLPNHIQTEQDLLDHFTKIAKAVTDKMSETTCKIRLNYLFNLMLKANNLTAFNTAITQIDAGAAVTFRNDRLLDLSDSSKK